MSRLLALAVGVLLFPGCRGRQADVPAATAVTPTAAPMPGPATAPAYAPGLGELMTLQQMRHAKLWWAGEAGNWALADYELDELNEGFDDIVRYHPAHKDSPVPIKDAVAKIMEQPLSQTRQAIAKKDRRLFGESYQLVTEGCNACHRATNFGFNVVRRPAVNTFSNQIFSAAAATP